VNLAGTASDLTKTFAYNPASISLLGSPPDCLRASIVIETRSNDRDTIPGTPQFQQEFRRHNTK